MDHKAKEAGTDHALQETGGTKATSGVEAAQKSCVFQHNVQLPADSWTVTVKKRERAPALLC